MYADPSGEFIWFIVAGAVIGSYVGASVQQGTFNPAQWNSNWWKGAITGAVIGAGIGAFAASLMPTVAGGIFANGTTAAGGITNIWGITTSVLSSANINIGLTVLSGGNWDNAWKAGLIGAALGAWVGTGGLGLAKNGLFGSRLAGKLAYQSLATSMRSIGNNWIRNKDLLSKVNVGVGPITLTFGREQKLLQFGPNAASIITNGLGLINGVFGGNVEFDKNNLALHYGGGLYDKYNLGGTWGAHSIIYDSRQRFSNGIYYDPNLIGHELHHLWDSRALGNTFLLNYGLQFILNGFSYENNYYEQKAFGNYYNY